MAMIEGIAIGDLHLDALSSLFPDEGLKLQEMAIRKAMEYAASKGLSDVVFLGDIGNKPVLSHAAFQTFFNILWDYPDLRKHVYLGNHDINDVNNHSLEPFVTLLNKGVFKNLNIYIKPAFVSLDGVPVNFLPYPTASANAPENQLVFAHIERRGALRDNGTKITKGDEDHDNNTWIVGHLHTHQDIGKWHYPGTLYQRTFGENSSKGFSYFKAVMSKSGKLKVQIDWIPIKTPYKLVNLDVESTSDLSTIKDDKHTLYKIFLSKNVKLPDNFLTKHPNVVDILGYTSKVELGHLKLVSAAMDEGIYDMAEELPLYLKSAFGATDKQIRRATSLLESILDKVRSSSEE